MMLRFLPLALLLLTGAAAAHGDTPAMPLLASVDGLPLGQLPKQQLPATGCAAYLWSDGTTHALVAMASADPAQIRLSLDGTIADYPRVAQHGIGGLGFAGTTTYHSGTVTATLEMTIVTESSLTQGAAVRNAVLTLARAGHDTVVLPVGGLIGCAPPPGAGK
jgi:hypothetical protein